MRRFTQRVDGKPALNAVELAHAKGRARDMSTDETKNVEQTRDEEEMRTGDRRLVDAYSFD